MSPEDYWISLADNIIGLDAVGDSARQAPTYQAIVSIILERGQTCVLDIGCNYAPLAHYLYGAGFTGDYIGLDSNVHAIVNAAYPCYVGNLRRLEYGNRAWPCIVIKDVLEHLESAEPLREAFRACGRYLILAMYIPWRDEPGIIYQHENGYYINTYNRDDIIRLARECDFVLIDERTVAERNGMPNLVTVWERIA